MAPGAWIQMMQGEGGLADATDAILLTFSVTARGPSKVGYIGVIQSRCEGKHSVYRRRIGD